MSTTVEFSQYFPKSARRVLIVNTDKEGFIQHFKQGQETELTLFLAENKLSKHTNPTEIRTVLGTLGKGELPFENNQFDLIIGENLFSECHDLLKSIKEIHRILMPKAFLITIEFNVQFWENLLTLLNGDWKNCYNGGFPLYHFFTPASLTKLLSSFHFTILGMGVIELHTNESFSLKDGFIQLDRFQIGPLSEEEYKRFITKKFITVAAKTE